MTDAEVENYVSYLHAHLPAAYGHLRVEQVRAILDAEAAYFEQRFGPIRGWRALLRAIFGRGDPPPATIEELLPLFEEHALQALATRGDLTHEDIRAVMRIEGEAGPGWTPLPATERDEPA